MFSSISRRQIISLIGFLGIGTVAAVSVPVLGKFLASKAQAQGIFEEVYKGRKYKILTDTTTHINIANTRFETQTLLFIDGKRVKIAHNSQTQKYMTPLLFGEFNSPEEVAKILIDLGIKIPSSEVQLDPNVD